MIEAIKGKVSDLERTIIVNEEIKRIVSASAEIRLAAINAMLIAKRSGEKSVGFAVVSTELRVFSRQLDGYMQSLTELISGLIYSVARMLNQSRMQRIVQTAMDQSKKAGVYIEKLACLKMEHMQIARQDIVKEWDVLTLQILRAERLCRTGVALSRSAKIEAAHGGDMASTLGQMAAQIEGTVGSMRTILMALKARVEQ